MRCGEGEGHVEASEGLEEDHAEADSLKGVEDAEPEPQGAAEKGGGEGCVRPGEIEADV